MPHSIGAAHSFPHTKPRHPRRLTTLANSCRSVDVTDLLGLLGQFGDAGAYDTDGSGTVDVTDLLALLGEFGSDCGGGGTEWRLMFRQTAGFYQAADAWVNYNDADPANDNYSILDSLEDCRGADGKFDLKIVWPKNERDVGNSNTWRQATNPVTSGVNGVDGYEPVDIRYSAFANVDAEGNDDGNFYGLEHNTDPISLLDGSVNHGYWFYAVIDTMQLSTVSLTDNFLM